ncbi:hypothetical protein C475_04536 [Halosimplex carlsbadense 2-9-1]|uniref:Uncharacterized protein n=1 Tax=Halosimplex carlsbadense 2-9-1 TaxID=797114 RepID=M0D084_9EURY|nr:hypothetical protein [Halosimplex carlsbadense]ELZ28875.1 hypothetical protein C475_04536 [Halosimplex carlsbadense 2-9-1]
MGDRRPNYALVPFQQHLGQNEESLAVPWAEFVGDETDELTFEAPTDEATDAYLELQAYDVEEYGHEIRVNGTALSGFDIPPRDGWQQWMDTLSGIDLVEGENTIKFERDTDTTDAFVVGVVVVHWKEPV